MSTSPQSQALIGIIIFNVGLFLVSIGQMGLPLIFSGFGFMLGAYWRQTHPIDRFEKEKQSKQKEDKATFHLANSDLPPVKEESVFEKIKNR